MKNNIIKISFIVFLIITIHLHYSSDVKAKRNTINLSYLDSDWIVTSTEKVENSEIILNGNLTIKNGGSLTLLNTTLKLNCSTNGSYHIEVQNGGGLFVYDKDNNHNTKHDSSVITTNKSINNNCFTFWIRSGAIFEMKNSELWNCGYKNNEEMNEGLFIESDNTLIENCQLSENYNGIIISSSNFNMISNCKIIDNDKNGICLINGSNNNRIENCSIMNNYDGIYFKDANENEIKNCILENNEDESVSIYKSDNNILESCNISNIVLQYVSNISISNCRLYSNSSEAIKAWYSDFILIDKCEISLKSYGYKKYVGIEFYGSSNNLILNCDINNCNYGIYLMQSSNFNEISNNRIQNNNRGIVLWKSIQNTTIENCEILANKYGIRLEESSANNIILKCNISNNEEYGIYAWSFSNENLIYHNNFENNSNQIYIGNTFNRWDEHSQGNYWSDYNGLDNGANGRVAGDGIGDTYIPHLSLDSYPFINPSGWIHYEINLSDISNNQNTVNNKTVQEDFFINFNIIIIGTIVTLLTLILSFFFIGTEIGKYSLYSSLGPLYTKRRKKKDQTYGVIKKEVLTFISDNPGESYNSIKRTLELNNGTLSYYLMILERDRKIKSERDGIYKRFYPSKGNIIGAVIELSDIQKRIYKYIAQHPGSSQIKISDQLNIIQSNVNYHINLMVNARLIRLDRDGNRTKCYIFKEAG